MFGKRYKYSHCNPSLKTEGCCYVKPFFLIIKENESQCQIKIVLSQDIFSTRMQYASIKEHPQIYVRNQNILSILHPKLRCQKQKKDDMPFVSSYKHTGHSVSVQWLWVTVHNETLDFVCTCMCCVYVHGLKCVYVCVCMREDATDKRCHKYIV